MKQSVDERRFWVRAKRVLSIQYRLIKTRRKQFDANWRISTTQDMSYGGLSFYTDMEFKKDEVLEMRVVMSGILDIFNGYGRVVRVERKDTGSYFLTAIKFVDVGQKRQAKSYTSSSKRKSRSPKLAPKRK